MLICKRDCNFDPFTNGMTNMQKAEFARTVVPRLNLDVSLHNSNEYSLNYMIKLFHK
jgi:hypothetical protein